MDPAVAAHVAALETLAGRIRAAGVILVTIDGWDRWGSANADEATRKQYEDEGSKAWQERATCSTELEALVARLRTEAPAAVVAWADAHVTFLTEFVAACGDDKDRSTSRSVAEGERDLWLEVRAGKRASVDENNSYVTREPVRYRELFGVEP